MNPWILAAVVAVGITLLSRAAAGSSSVRRVLGYRGGKSFPIDVVLIDGVWLEAGTANAYERMRNAAWQEAGIRLKANSGWRSMEQQTEFFELRADDPDKACRERGICGVVATPGHSNHQAGTAVDVDTQSDARTFPWLEANARRFGFANTVKSERWHWERVG